MPYAQAIQAQLWEKFDKVLPEVFYDNVPLSDVTKNLRDQFKNEFDVLLPSAGFSTSPSSMDPNTGLPGGLQDAALVGISLRLNNVNVSQVFNAMNLSFEINKLPLLWDLTTNGSRPTAVLRILDPPKPAAPAVPPPLEGQKHAVFYIGDLLGSWEAGGLKVGLIVKTLDTVCEEAFHHGPHISTHEATQLLVVTGSSDEVDLVKETLTALKEKAKCFAERKERSKAADSKGRLAEPKTP